MFNKLKIFILIITTSIILHEVAIADSSKNRQALVIGNGDYANGWILDNPVNDAKDISAKLKSLGFTVTNANNLGRNKMWDVLNEFKKNINNNTEIAIFYYAGHGAQDNNNINYLIPIDSQTNSVDDLKRDAVSAQDILQEIEAQSAQFNLLILDACRNLPYKGSRGGNRGLAEMTSSTKNAHSLIVFSTAAGETAADAGANGRNSPFAQILLQNLDKDLPLINLITNVAYEVDKEYAQRPYTNGSIIIPPHLFLKPQTPQIASNVDDSSDLDEPTNLVNCVFFSDEQKYQEAFQPCQAAAKEGDAIAQVYLGFMYENGYGAAQDYEKAEFWYQKAADQGDAIAQTFLGFMYEKGNGVAQDYEKAVVLYQQAADQGDAVAQHNLGVMYDEGYGVAEDDKKAVYWYQKAADQDYQDAQNNLGVMYEGGYGVAQDYKKAFYWYQKAADQDDADAQNNLGFVYEKGNGVAQDYKKAVYWYQKAVDQGHVRAQNNLGVMYEGGHGVAKDYKQAFKLYQQAAQQGDDLAQYNLGFAYYEGKGIAQDYRLAYMWFAQAAQRGDDDSAEMIKEIAKELNSSKLKEAKKLAEKCQISEYKDCGY